MEVLEGLDLLAGADEFDRHARHALHGQRRSAAGVAVELRHDHAVELERLVEGLCAFHGVLAGHGVDHQIDLVRADGAVDPREFLHQRLVDREAAGRVENDDGDALLLRAGHASLADRDRIGDAIRRVHRHVELSPEHGQLLDGRRSLQVRRHEHHAAALFLDLAGELRAGGRLAGALQAAEHEDRRLAVLEVERVVHGPHQIDELAVHDADELLRRVERLEHLRADGLLGHAVEKLVDDVIGDVGLEQCGADPGEPLPHVRLGQPPAAPERVEGGRQRGGQRFEHGGSGAGNAE